MRYFISIFGKLNYILGHLEGYWIDHWFLSLILHSILAFFLSFSSCPLLISCSFPSLLPYFNHFYFSPYILSLPINLSPLPLSSFSFFLLSSSIYIFLLSSYFSLYSPHYFFFSSGLSARPSSISPTMLRNQGPRASEDVEQMVQTCGFSLDGVGDGEWMRPEPQTWPRTAWWLSLLPPPLLSNRKYLFYKICSCHAIKAP